MSVRGLLASWLVAALVAAASVAASPAPASAQEPEPSRLLQATDLEYLGAFTVPDGATGAESSLAYAGAGLAYNPANDSLFITGHDWHQLTAEISVPLPGVAGTADGLPRAEMLIAPVDATDGHLVDIATPPETTYARVGGYLVDDANLIVSAWDFYDASGDQIRSHLLTDTSLGSVSPMTTISDDVPARWLGGPMAHIPSRWQSAFGGDPYLTGLGGISIVSNSSAGPAAATFSLESLNGQDSAQLVLGYPLEAALDGPETQSDLWNLTSTMRGIVFPDKTATVLFFGTHGTGPYCYGTGAACNDPVHPHQGTHAYPYRNQVWAYDANDLAAAHRGEVAPELIAPYVTFELSLPFTAEYAEILGAAYDSDGGRIFVTQGRGDGDLPIIHVFAVSESMSDAGDVDCSGHVSLADALMVAQYVAGSRIALDGCALDLATELDLRQADMNGDGMVDGADVVEILGRLVGG